MEFVEGGQLMGMVLEHPNGGPRLGLRLNPERSAGFADFDFFAIGVPDRSTLEALAARLSELGEPHGGVRLATAGWILPSLHGPDRHEVRFYTTEQHTSFPADTIARVENPREAAAQREAELGQAAGR